MKILHTSDWHLGKMLYQQRRHDEFKCFLDWLVKTIAQRKIEALLIAGDVFNTTTPSPSSQTLYYDFLKEALAAGCRHIVVTAGNHDSPMLLTAPKALLKSFNVHVVGGINDENVEDEVVVLTSQSGSPVAVVCAVPYLRDRDIRSMQAGESVEDKEVKLADAVFAHYDKVFQIAKEKTETADQPIPVIGMGHLFIRGSSTYKNNDERDLYVGTLGQLPLDRFPAFDYFALGHLHMPQKLGGKDTVRYSGSPVAMNFDEARFEKSVVELDVTDSDINVELIPVPVFQKLCQVKGNREAILQELKALVAQNTSIWAEVVYDGEEIIPNLLELVQSVVKGSAVELLRIQNKRLIREVMKEGATQKSLDDLNVFDVFEKCLTQKAVPETDRDELRAKYREVVDEVLSQSEEKADAVKGE